MGKPGEGSRVDRRDLEPRFRTAYGLGQGTEAQSPHLYIGDGDSHSSRAGMEGKWYLCTVRYPQEQRMLLLL